MYFFGSGARLHTGHVLFLFAGLLGLSLVTGLEAKRGDGGGS